MQSTLVQITTCPRSLMPRGSVAAAHRVRARTLAVATLTVATLALFAACPVSAQQNPDLAPYMIADRASEVTLARSAAPKHVSDSATVLVLTRTGFVEATRGTNGFTCLVIRSFGGAIGDPAFWNPRVRAPHCLNPPAVRTVLPEMLRRAEWIMAGVSPTGIATRTQRAYASHEFSMPAVGSMAYMLSHEQYLVDDNWMPHMMFYFDKSMSPAAFGAGDFKAPVIDGSVGDKQSPLWTLLIPVPQWSDGTPAGGH